jgi:hypothetical protein
MYTSSAEILFWGFSSKSLSSRSKASGLLYLRTDEMEVRGLV